MMETDAETLRRRKLAFAAWEAYRPAFRESVRQMAPSLPPDAGSDLLDNPIVMLIFVDGYLGGWQAAVAHHDVQSRYAPGGAGTPPR